MNHKYIRKYKGKNGKWIYVYVENEKKRKTKVKDKFENMDVKDAANIIRNDSVETLIYLNNYFKAVKSFSNNSEDSVKLNDSDIKSVKKFKVTLHNHPKNSSFSLQDIMMALHSKQIEMFVCSEKFDYHMKFDPEIDVDINKFTKEYSYINNRVHENFVDRINSNDMTIKEAELNHFHIVWNKMQKVFPDFIVSYSRTPVNREEL